MTKNQQQPKYSFDEIVKIVNSKYNDDTILNTTGYVAGMVYDDGFWRYGVFLFDVEEVWRFDEEDLKSTGEFMSEDFSSSGGSIKVIVDDKGEGEIKEDN
jgi:hypothetical protein